MNPLMLIKGELRRSFGGILALALVLALSLSLGVCAQNLIPKVLPTWKQLEWRHLKNKRSSENYLAIFLKF